VLEEFMGRHYALPKYYLIRRLKWYSQFYIFNLFY